MPEIIATILGSFNVTAGEDLLCPFELMPNGFVNTSP